MISQRKDKYWEDVLSLANQEFSQRRYPIASMMLIYLVLLLMGSFISHT